ncbi:hypothetical protein QC334_31325 [Streptomyces sp. DH18]|uniref:hypothetical protein n=1 Tax=unclassified Streptomyces TaxID=2593676 RepID=UPI001E5FE99C|nr:MULTISPECIES: hypothetical protein [unclassified Streptomyces]MDG9687171.1 hypothetical protein [Streptomyces sp. DH18]
MSEQTPSQAEGQREPDLGEENDPPRSDPSGSPRTTPSQAEGDRDEQHDEAEAAETAGD